MPSISFDLNIVTKKIYDIVIKGFTPSDSWFVQVFQKFPIAFGMKVGKYFSITMTSKTNVISSIKLREMLTFNLLAGRNSISFSMKFKEYISKTISQRSVLVGSWKERSRLATAISNFNFSATFSPLLAVFYTLGDWDSSTLGTLDTETLVDLDYTTI